MIKMLAAQNNTSIFGAIGPYTDQAIWALIFAILAIIIVAIWRHKDTIKEIYKSKYVLKCLETVVVIENK